MGLCARSTRTSVRVKHLCNSCLAVRCRRGERARESYTYRRTRCRRARNKVLPPPPPGALKVDGKFMARGLESRPSFLPPVTSPPPGRRTREHIMCALYMRRPRKSRPGHDEPFVSRRTLAAWPDTFSCTFDFCRYVIVYTFVDWDVLHFFFLLSRSLLFVVSVVSLQRYRIIENDLKAKEKNTKIIIMILLYRPRGPQVFDKTSEQFGTLYSRFN